MKMLTVPAARAVCQVLWSTEHIPVDANVDDRDRVNVWPVGRELTTLEEVTALGAFLAVTDAPLRWFPVAPEVAR